MIYPMSWDADLPAKMETKSPHWLPGWKTNQCAVLLDNRFRSGTREEVEIQCTTDHPVLDKRDV